MDSKTFRAICVLLVAGFYHVEANGKWGWYEIIITGCTESYIQMTCPGDDIITVADVRLVTSNTSDPCIQHKPAHTVAVPIDMSHMCDPGENHCVYIEDICEGMTQCAFYVSPHLVDDKEEPTVESEVVIEYHCMPGKGRRGGPIVLGLLAAVSTCAIAIFGGIILFREFKDVGETSAYNNFTNDTSATAQPTSFTNPTASTMSYQQSSPDQISVTLQGSGEGGEAAAENGAGAASPTSSGPSVTA